MADNLPTSSVDVTESGSLNLPEPSGPHRPVMGLLYVFTRWGEWSAPRPGRFPPGKDLVPIVQEAGWVSEPVLTGVIYLALHWDSIPERCNPWRVAIPTELSRSTTVKVSYPIIYLFVHGQCDSESQPATDSDLDGWTWQPQFMRHLTVRKTPTATTKTSI
jgi:hypothetical protein